MVLVIDTSSALSAVALLSAAGEPVREHVELSGPSFDPATAVRSIVDPSTIGGVMVATGPGSFTGLRVGVSYALGLAYGLRVPLLGVSTLELAAARSIEPATGLAEAGRGRVYFLTPGGSARIAEPGELPTGHPAVGWLRDSTRAAVRQAGVRLLEEPELRSFVEAAGGLLGGARELGYDTVRLDYLQSFGILS